MRRLVARALAPPRALIMNQPPAAQLLDSGEPAAALDNSSGVAEPEAGTGDVAASPPRCIRHFKRVERESVSADSQQRDTG